MAKLYKPVMKNTCLRNFLFQSNMMKIIKSLKYKTIEKETEYVHHYGWCNTHLYAIGRKTSGFSITIFKIYI